MVLCLLLILVARRLVIKRRSAVAPWTNSANMTASSMNSPEFVQRDLQRYAVPAIHRYPQRQAFEGPSTACSRRSIRTVPGSPPMTRKCSNAIPRANTPAWALHITLDKNRILTVIAPISGGPAPKRHPALDRARRDRRQIDREHDPDQAVKILTGPDGTSSRSRCGARANPS